MPSPNQAKPTASVKPAVPHFLQETCRDSTLAARKEVQPVEEMLLGGGGGEKREKGAEERKRKRENWEGCSKLEQAASSGEIST